MPACDADAVNAFGDVNMQRRKRDTSIHCRLRHRIHEVRYMKPSAGVAVK